LHPFELSLNCSSAVSHPAICRFEDETKLSLQAGVSTPSNRNFPSESAAVLPVFLQDEQGRVYFHNGSTGESTWKHLGYKMGVMEVGEISGERDLKRLWHQIADFFLSPSNDPMKIKYA